MDTALKLRMSIDSRQPMSGHDIESLLAQSALVQKFTSDFIEEPLFAVFRIMGLCEIPYAEKLPYTQRLIDYINQTIATDEGFSCLGGVKELVPCYIGIGKTVRALIAYSEYLEREDMETEKLISQGVEYMLRHNMYQRLSTGKPISAHIIDIMMPQNYVLSLTDLTYIAGKRKLQGDSRARPLLSLLKEKQVAENQWKIDYLYSYRGYIGFEGRRKASE